MAWLFNLRGADIAFNPVFFSYAVISADSVVLFIQKESLDIQSISSALDGVKIKPYDEIWTYLTTLGASLTESAQVCCPN